MTFPTSEMLGKHILSKLETTEAWVVPIYPDEPQPDQSSRLLNEATVMLKSETGHPYLADISYFLGLQDTKTASIKDEQFRKKCENCGV